MSPELRVMLSPAGFYRQLAKSAPSSSAWKRPLFLAIFLGCAISFAVSGCLSLRLLIGGTLTATFVPLVEIAALAILWCRRAPVPFTRAIDLFFIGHAPWCLWFLVFAAVCSFTAPVDVFLWMHAAAFWCSFAVALLWSAYIDYCFFRWIFQRSSAGAARALVLQRAVSWTLGFAIFGGPGLLPELARIFGR
jgi:hypothetical protein